MIYHRSMRYRLIQTYTLVLFVTIMSVALITYMTASKTMVEQSSNYAFDVIDQISDSFDKCLQLFDKTVSIIYSYNTILDAFESPRSSSLYSQLIESKQIREILRNMIYMQKDISKIQLYSLKNHFLYELSYDSGYAFQESDIFLQDSRLMIDVDDMETARPKSNRIYRISSNGGQNFLSVCHIITRENDGAEIGVVNVEFNMETLENIGRQTALSNNGLFLILDEKGEVFFPDDSEVQNGASDLLRARDQEKAEFNHQDYYSAWRAIADLGWNIVYLTPVRSVLVSVNRIRDTIILVGLLSLLASGAMIVRYASKFTEPLKRITDHLKVVESGNFKNLEQNYPYCDEISDLTHGLNSMVNKINNLIESEYKNQLLFKDAEFNALTSQINPHFLYNIMENISGLGYMKQIPEIGMMCENLIDLLKYSINSKNPIVTLGEEIEKIEKYILLQNIRFGNGILLEMDISEELLQRKILKFSLQPLVENAILHGLEEKSYHGHVTVRARLQDTELCISIEDDGVGIPAELLPKLKERRPPSGSKTHIGLSNISERIKNFFGDPYGLEIQSAAGQGTVVVIRMPADV